MKAMEFNALSWVKLATSNDATRFNLKEVYRDKNSLVATDGHRLHISNNMPDATPGFASGLDAEFPNYKQVMPSDPPLLTLSLFEGLGCFEMKGMIKALEKLLALVSCYACKSTPVKLGTEGGNLTITYKSNMLESTLRIQCPEAEGKEIPTIWINLKYLIDGLKLGFASASVYSAGISLDIYSDYTRPLIIRSEHQKAVIMPLNPDRL